jgi:AbrB family looped-hinge helix DNA binding protein
MPSSHGNEGAGPVFRTTVRGKGQITLPDEVRRAAKLEEGDLLEIELQDEGVIVLRPVGTIDRSQAWFWTEEWQRREREASDAIREGRTIKFASGEELLRYLDELADEPDEGLDS